MSLKKIIFFIIPFNVLLDILLLFFDKGQTIPLIRGSVLGILILYSILSRIDLIKHYRWILVFSIYTIIVAFLASKPIEALNMTSKVLIPILCFIIGFVCIKNISNLKKLNFSIVILYCLLIINFILSQIYKLGTSAYSDDTSFLVGNLDDGWNIFTYSVLLAPFILFFMRSKEKKIMVLFLAFLIAVLVIVSMKRIAILGLVLGLFIYVVYSKNISKGLQAASLSIIVLLLTLPLYLSIITSRFEARSDRFEEGAIYEEPRYLETFYVWEETLSFKNVDRSLFGLEGFYSVGNYGNGIFGSRPLHVDYNLIVNTIGLVGLIFYFVLFHKMYKLFKKVKKRSNLPYKYQLYLSAMFMTLFISQFVTSFSGQMYHISYRSIVFIYMGAIISIFYNSRFLVKIEPNHNSLKL